MSSRGKHAITTILVLLVMAPAMAACRYTPSVSLDGQVVACFPTEDYLRQQSSATFRTSLDFTADLNFASFEFGPFNASLGASYMAVSRSLASGNSVLRPYQGFGLCLRFGYDFDMKMGIEAGCRYLLCFFSPFYDSFFVAEAFASPKMEFAIADWFHIIASSPVTFSLKRDALSVKAGLECKLEFRTK